jgi:hypothetical protein
MLSVVLIIAALLFFISRGFRTSHWASLSLSVIVSIFLLYRAPALYDYGLSYLDYDLGYPFRWVTTQNDAGPYRFRIWALAVDSAAGSLLWGTYQLVHRYEKNRKRETVANNLPQADPPPAG